jgi:hypothetical protein
MTEDDFIIDDILKSSEPKKKKNSKRKGKRGELDVCDLFSKRFPEHKFSRVVGSGNRWAQANLTETAKSVLTGDLVVPSSFKYCVEVKTGYPEIDLCSALDGGNAKIDSFLEQATKDAERVKKKPLLIWKKDRQPWLAFINLADVSDSDKNIKVPITYYLLYREWFCASFRLLLEQSELFWFLPSEQSSTT